MEALQHSQRFAGHVEFQQGHPLPPPPPPHQGPSWYNQFQFQPQSQWDPQLPPHTAMAPSHPPYPSYNPSSYPPQHYPFPPQPHYSAPMHPPQGYAPPPPNQAWGDQSWGWQHGWGYPDGVLHNNEEDWAAKARAWASAKSAMDDQPQMGYTYEYTHTVENAGELQNHMYHEHQQQSLVTPGHHHIQPPVTNQPPVASFVHVPSAHVSDFPTLPYAPGARGAFAADADSMAVSSPVHLRVSSVHQQEVPSSYSSIQGGNETGITNEPFPLHVMSDHQAGPRQHDLHQSLGPSIGRSHSLERLDVDIRSVKEERLHHSLPYYTDAISGDQYTSSAPSAAVHSWAPEVAPSGSVFPSVPPVPLEQQYDSPFLPPTTHSSSLFGRTLGPANFQAAVAPPVVSSVASTFSLGAAAAVGIHPAPAFPGDPSGVFSIPDRPKKAPVPNWLREEIIKNKNILANSLHDRHPEKKELSPLSVSHEDIDHASWKSDQPDNKSVDSTSRSNEDEDEDEEDEVEAARTAAINQQIKRIVTEVLLKVTDELFDEIATKVVNEEDDSLVEVPVQVPARLPLADGNKETKRNESITAAKSISRSSGDVLGLSSYASDEEDDSKTSPSRESSQKEMIEHAASDNLNLNSECQELHESSVSVGMEMQNSKHDDNKSTPSIEENLVYHEANDPKFVDKRRGGGSKTSRTSESSVEDSKREAIFKSQAASQREHGSEKTLAVSTGAVINRESTHVPIRYKDNEGTDGKKEDRANKREKEEYRADSKGDKDDSGSALKEVKGEKRGSLKDQKVRDRVSRPEDRSHSEHYHNVNDKAGRKERKDLNDKFSKSREESSHTKRETTKGIQEDRCTRDPKHKRYHSPVVSRGRRSIRDNVVDSIGSDSSDETNKRSRERKPRSSRHSLSSSPSRHRKRRQVSRSPHRKHSQRRASPFSSESRRRSRSRSGSPFRRRK